MGSQKHLFVNFPPQQKTTEFHFNSDWKSAFCLVPKRMWNYLILFTFEILQEKVYYSKVICYQNTAYICLF